MQFGLDIVTDRTLSDLRSLWRACDENGLRTIGVPDSPAICRDTYLSVAACLESAPGSRAMTAVSNPMSRDLGVTASALCTLAERFPGRIDFGIGTGDSALWGVGLRSSTVARLREYVVALRALLRGEECTFGGRTFSMRWPQLPDAAADIRIFVACSGPKVLTAAAEVADGAILHLGFSPEDVAYIDALIEEGSDRGGRDPDAFERWWHCSMRFASSLEEGQAENLGINPGWLTLKTMDGKRVPEEFQEPLRQLTDDFRNLDAEYASMGRPAMLVARAKELGLYEWLSARSSRLWGTPDDIAARLREYHDRGMDRWIFYGGGRDLDLEHWIRTFGGHVLPKL
jgi:alkanesulfonate monooxygenase SsuD/methylene tetrahydromethanopterin reductase-like flavin-dependent oxidoreductase (luciferase family)